MVQTVIVTALVVPLIFVSDSRLLRAQSGPTQAEILASSPPLGQLLVLHNDSVLLGSVTMQGEHYEIQREGLSMRVPVREVALVAQSLVDAYQQKRASRGQLTATEHLDLAEWCLRHSLWAEASLELLDARGKEPDRRQLELLERRLLVNSARRQAEEKETETISKPQESGSAGDLESPIELPKGALELFTRRVQPLLVNNCTASGCHRPKGPTEFSLSRALLHGESNQKTTQHNLSEALSQIDRADPTQSPLLVIPLKPHGGLDHAIFPPHRRALRQLLVQWVALVTDEMQSPHLAEVDQPTIFLPSQLVPSQPTVQPTVQRGVMPAAHWQAPRRVGGPPRVRFGATRPGQRQRSPFDAAALSGQISRLAEEGQGASPATPSPEASAKAGMQPLVEPAALPIPPDGPEFQSPASSEAKGD